MHKTIIKNSWTTLVYNVDRKTNKLIESTKFLRNMCSKQNISKLETQIEDNSRSMFHTTETTSDKILLKLVQTKNRQDWNDGFRIGLKRPLKRTKKRRF